MEIIIYILKFILVEGTVISSLDPPTEIPFSVEGAKFFSIIVTVASSPLVDSPFSGSCH